jgi:Ferredoxin-like domain in Api92-like protein
MPTETSYRLVIEGPLAEVAKFRADETLWQVEPWSLFYSAHEREHDASLGRLVYEYADDWKRPGPSVAEMAARYPGLTMVCEYCDEFGSIAGRARYAGGVEVEAEE